MGASCQDRSLRYHTAKERLFYSFGVKMARWPTNALVPGIVLLCAIIFMVGLTAARLETRVNKLWVESGGRLESEDAYVDAARAVHSQSQAGGGGDSGDAAAVSGSGGGSTGQSQQVVISVADPASANYLARARLESHLALMESLRDMVVTTGGADFNLNDLCFKPSISGFDAYANEVPCIRVTVLDCFAEGGYDFSEQLQGLLKLSSFQFLNTSFGVDGYLGRPSFRDADVDVHEVVRHGCPGFATKISALHWQPGLIMGGIERTGSTATGPVARVAAVQSVLLLASSSDVASRLHIDDEGIAAEALRLWRAKFLDVVHEQQTSGDGAVSNYGLSSDSLSILLGRVSSASVPLIVAGYVIMVAFMLGAMTQWNSDESQAVFGLLSLLLVVCSTLAAFGFTSLLGVPFNAASTQVLPFLALGLGVDDLFVVAFAFRDVRRNWDDETRKSAVVDQIGNCFAVAGASITLTSASNFLAFMAGSLVPLPAVTDFCYQAAAVVAFNYLALLIAAPGLLSFHAWLSNRGYGARWPRSGKSPQPPPPTAIDARVRQGSPASDSGVAGVNAKGLPGSLYDMGPDAGGSHAELVADHSSQRQSRRSFQAWCGTTYADFILAPKVKLALLLTGAIFLAVCVWGITLVDDGLDIDDVAPSDSPEAQFLEQRFNYFSWFPGQIMVPDIDYPNKQAELLQFEEQLKSVAHVTLVPRSWLRELTDWVASTSGLDANGVIPPSRFYREFTTWTTSSGTELQAVISGATEFSYNAEGALSLTYFDFYVDELWTVDDFVDLIGGVRGLADASGLGAFPRGVPFTFWEQYVRLREFLVQNLAIALATVFAVTMILLFDIIAAALVTFTILVVVVEIFGVMGFMAIKFSALPAVSLIMSVGIAVEFTAHLVQAYQHSGGSSRTERSKQALELMGVPILNGGLSTLVGIIMLAFSQFGFIVKYFFGVFAAVIAVGLFNGLVMLPIVLTYVGPAEAFPDEAGETDGSGDSDRIVGLTKPAVESSRDQDDVEAAARVGNGVDVCVPCAGDRTVAGVGASAGASTGGAPGEAAADTVATSIAGTCSPRTGGPPGDARVCDAVGTEAAGGEPQATPTCRVSDAPPAAPPVADGSGASGSEDAATAAPPTNGSVEGLALTGTGAGPVSDGAIHQPTTANVDGEVAPGASEVAGCDDEVRVVAREQSQQLAEASGSEPDNAADRGLASDPSALGAAAAAAAQPAPATGVVASASDMP